MRVLLPAVLLLACLTARAEIYKCTQPDGRKSFQQQPCKAGTQEVIPERVGPPVEVPKDVEVTAAPTDFSLEETGIFASVLYIDWCSAGVPGFRDRIAKVNAAWRARHAEWVAKVERSEEYKSMRAEALGKLERDDVMALDHLNHVCTADFIARIDQMGRPAEPARTGRPPAPRQAQGDAGR